MTDKEKAKAYDEALERATREYNLRDEQPECIDYRKRLEFIFPKLAESEDERIRKEIIEYLKLVDMGDEDYAHPMISGWIAWLEKQKEQKQENQNEQHKQTADEAKKYNDAYEKGYKLGYENGCLEQKPTEWSEEDEQMYEGLIYDLQKLEKLSDFPISINSYKWLKSRFKLLRPQPKQEWSNEDEEHLKAIINLILGGTHLAYEGDVNWLKDLPNRFSLQQKVKWSEEDEKHIQKAIECVYTNGFSSTVDFLRRIRPGWKPSEEQMTKLARATNRCVGVEDAKVLLTLYDDLNKL